jgi:hypothetical protein
VRVVAFGEHVVFGDMAAGRQGAARGRHRLDLPAQRDLGRQQPVAGGTVFRALIGKTDVVNGRVGHSGLPIRGYRVRGLRAGAGSSSSRVHAAGAFGVGYPFVIEADADAAVAGNENDGHERQAVVGASRYPGEHQGSGCSITT